MHIDTPISPVLIAVAVLLLLGLLAWAMRRLRPELTRVQWWVILGLRLGGLASLALLLLNPYAVETLPDPERYRIAVLADLSGSMHATDLGEGQERIEFIQGALDAALEASLINRLQSTAPTELYGFTDSLRALPPEGVEIQPGVTALGTSLESALSEQDLERRLAGLVVLTDGISLQGPPPLEIARAYRQADIPLNIVGVGSSGRTGDVSIALVAKTADPVVGEPLELVASVSNAFSESVTLSWEILTGDELLSSEEVTLPAGESTQISVIHEPERSGLHRYRARLTDVPALDQNPANDSAYAAADVLEPRVMKVLYLSNYLSDTYRFLRQALRSNPDWELHAIQRLNEERFVYAGLDEPEEDGLIGFAYAVDKLFDYSTVVLDTSVIADLDDAGRDALLGYLTRRGGGLLFLGAPQNLPSEMAYLLPVRQSEAMRENFDLALAFTPQPVFSDLAGGTLFRPPHAFLPEGKTAFLGLELARGARASLATRQRDIPILSQQAYGAGRVAYLGTEATWRWRMSSEHGLRQHDLFWTYLLGWLSTGGKPRLELPLQG
ncbi:MAG: vWA domain-containing protein, partial [Verrucomicrobiota bacterium]